MIFGRENVGSNPPPAEPVSSPVAGEKLYMGEKERAERAHDLAVRGFWRGAAYGLGGGIIGSLLLNRLSASYRVLRLPVKVAGVSMATFFGATFGSEHAIYRFSRPKIEGFQHKEVEVPLGKTIMDHRLAIFGGTIAGVVAVAAYRAFQNPHLSGSQRFMNIRLYGQMAGLLAIAGMAGIAAARSTVPDYKNNQQRSSNNNGNSGAHP